MTKNNLGEQINHQVIWDQGKKEVTVKGKDKSIDLFDFFNQIEYPEHFSFDKFEYENRKITIYLNQNQVVTHSRILEGIALQVYDYFTNIDSIEFVTALPSETLTKTYPIKWYKYQMGIEE